MSIIRNRVQFPIGKNDSQDIEFVTFSDFQDGKEHIALIGKQADQQEAPLVRIHSECLTGDVFFSSRCDCGEQLEQALDLIKEEGGIILYLRQEGRGIGLYNKIDSYELQLKGMDTYTANEELGFDKDLRDFSVAHQMLAALNVKAIRLLTNNPRKVKQITEAGVTVVERVPTDVFTKQGNEAYLAAKKKVGGHLLNL